MTASAQTHHCVWLRAELHDRFASYCAARDLAKQAVLEELLRPVLGGEIRPPPARTGAGKHVIHYEQDRHFRSQPYAHRWVCSCGARGSWMETHVQAEQGAAKHVMPSRGERAA